MELKLDYHEVIKLRIGSQAAVKRRSFVAVAVAAAVKKKRLVEKRRHLWRRANLHSSFLTLLQYIDRKKKV